jgi:undecaprenyl-diphosphatase
VTSGPDADHTDCDEQAETASPPLTTRSAAWLWPVLILAGLGALGVGLLLTDAISDGASYRFDAAILLALRHRSDLAVPIGPKWLELSAIDLSALGGFTLQWLLGGAALVFLLYIHKRAEAAWLGASAIGASLLNMTIKLELHRARPQIVPHLTMVDNASFPSGHAMISAAILLTIGAMVSETVKSTGARVYIMSFAGLLVFLIGVSRLYLGVHWPTDVLAGWCLGAVWALLVFAANRLLRRRAANKSILGTAHASTGTPPRL